jgi:hypothetical protein
VSRLRRAGLDDHQSSSETLSGMRAAAIALVPHELYELCPRFEDEPSLF